MDAGAPEAKSDVVVGEEEGELGESMISNKKLGSAFNATRT